MYEKKSVNCPSADIAESMNNFFCTFGETLSDKIPKAKKNPVLENDYDVDPQIAKFNFHVINNLQLAKDFGKFKSSKGCGTDGIASCFLKDALPVIFESLCDILNLSVAKVREVTKGNHRADASIG